MTDEKGNFKFGSVRHATLWGVDSMHSGDRDPPIFWAFFALIRSVSKRSSFWVERLFRRTYSQGEGQLRATAPTELTDANL